MRLLIFVSEAPFFESAFSLLHCLPQRFIPHSRS
jgi:hypothetical protein